MKRLAVLLVFMAATCLFADKIYLKDGTIITGEIVSQTADYYMVDTGDSMAVKIYRTNTEAVRREAVSSSSPSRAGGPGYTGESVRKNALVFNPVGLGLAAAGGIVDVDIEYQRALNGSVAFYLNPEFVSFGFGTYLSFGAGFYLLPLGKYLNGLYLSGEVVPIFGLDKIYVGVEAMLGWQWEFRSGFVLGLGLGVTYVNKAALHLHILKMGFSF